MSNQLGTKEQHTKIEQWIIYDSFADKLVFTGTYAECDRYLSSHNYYGYNYSQLRIRPEH